MIGGYDLKQNAHYLSHEFYENVLPISAQYDKIELTAVILPNNINNEVAL